ncbi:MAG: 3-isopropylmalate dehydrogenase, partial [Bauldia sp.]
LVAAADMLETAISETLGRGLRTADIWTEGTEKVGTREMGSAIIADLERLAGG